jgi:excisionase family DNA binding protein
MTRPTGRTEHPNRTPEEPRNRRTDQPGVRTEEPNRMSEYLSAAEAAKILGCSDTLIRKRIQSGELPATKRRGSWRILRDDLDAQSRPYEGDDEPPERENRRTEEPDARTEEPNRRTEPPNPEWREDLLAQVASLEADKKALARREEQVLGRAIDLERAVVMRDSRISDMETAHAGEVSDLRGQVAALEAKVREVLEERAEEIGELAKNITELVGKQQEMQTRVYELEPVASQVPMLQAAVEEKDATLSERERQLEVREHELGQVREDIDAIASRPVTGPVFRLLTKGKLRR